ncbi:MAG: hypothetical protein ACI9EF_001124 [Pseudohongiellaceae bacterium]|jgi:hypothetical protein
MHEPITLSPARQSTAASSSRAERGTTFAELMIATLILGLTIVGSTNSLTESATVYNYFAEGAHEALMLAQEVHEAALLLPWDADPGAPATFGPDVVTFWDLHEEEFSPPRSADYAVVSSHYSWTQGVEIDYVDLANPTVLVDPDVFVGEVQVRLRVIISQGEVEVDSFEWWMTEADDGE